MESHEDQSLEIIAQARAAVADRIVTPWWYHPVLGLLLAVYCVGLSLGGTTVRLISGVLFAFGLVALVRTYRRLTGVWVNGLDAGRPARWAKALGAIIAVALLASMSIGYWTELVWPVLALAVLLFAATIVLGRRFDEELRADLRSGV